MNQVMSILNQLGYMVKNIYGQRDIVEKVLKSLSSKFNHVVVVIEKSKNLIQLSLDEMMVSLISD